MSDFPIFANLAILPNILDDDNDDHHRHSIIIAADLYSHSFTIKKQYQTQLVCFLFYKQAMIE